MTLSLLRLALLSSLVVLAIASALVYGGTWPHYESGIVGLMLVVLAVWLGGLVSGGRVMASLLRWRWELLLFAGCFLFMVLQLLPLPIALLHTLAPENLQWRQELFPELTWAPISLAIDQGQRNATAWLLLLPLFLACYIGARHWRWLTTLMVVGGAMLALLGLISLERGVFLASAYDFDGHGRDARATFINANYYAATLVFPLALAVFAALEPWVCVAERRQSAWLRSAAMGVAAVFLAWAIAASQSRGGQLMLLLVVLGLVVGLVFPALRRQPGKLFIIAATVWALAFLAITTGLASAVMAAIGTEGERASFWRIGVAAIADYPLLGTGIGSAPWVIDGYAQPGVAALWFNNSHVSLLDLILEGGIPFAVIFLLLVIRVCCAAFVRPPSGEASAPTTPLEWFRYAMLVASLAIVTHSLISSSLHTFAVKTQWVMAMGLLIGALDRHLPIKRIKP